jgi:hypothetical protein
MTKRKRRKIKACLRDTQLTPYSGTLLEEE